MENFEERWVQVERVFRERFGKLPDMEGMLFLIGVNELGQGPERKKFTKEQKQDLMHIAVCTLLSQLGYYAFIGVDGDGWPHFDQLLPVPTLELKAQEQMMKECMVRYFDI
jgi:hypothetical protein